MSGEALECPIIIGHANSAATLDISESHSVPEMSLIISTPFSSAVRAVEAFLVSMLKIVVLSNSRIFSITLMTRFCSSCGDTFSLYGLVDSPPISIISAPSFNSSL